MRLILMFLFFLGGLSSEAQTWQSLDYNSDQDSLELNPIKGLTPLYNVSNDFPHSIRGKIVGLDSVMLGIDNFEWGIFDRFLDTVGSGGRFGYIHVNVDMGFNRSDLPGFLSNVDRIYYDGNDPEDSAGVPSLVVNYNDEELMTALLNFIETFGLKYNNDPRVFLVHYGLYGIFGEWDLGFGKKFVPEGEDWEMSEANQLRITSAYEAAFDNKNLLARFPENVPESQAVGYSDGLYFGGSISDDPIFNWFFHPKLKIYNADLNWKNFPIGGELDPDIQGTVWENFPNTVIGLPGQTQETDAIFDLTRPTFLFQDYMFNKDSITEASNPSMWANALKATKKTGYTFYINEFRLSAKDNKPAVEVNIQNKGLAPMYANWDVEFGYVDANGDVQSLGVADDWNLSTIQPDVDGNYRSLISETAIPNGTHTFVLRIINPLETISTQAKPVRFANSTQDADAAGWLSLGQGTISEGDLGFVPRQVSIMFTIPSSATMGLQDQFKLKAQVFPGIATNRSVTWSSNRPRTASVDENGLVTSYNLSGVVEITAHTQDGGIEDVVIMTVEPFWQIPGLVEAEGYSEVFNAQINPTPVGEDGGSVLGFIADDSYMEYIVNVTEAADFVVDFRASSFSGEGEINILNENGDTLGSVSLTPSTGDYDIYETYTSDAFPLPIGKYTLKMDVVTSSFNLNSLNFRLDPCTGFDQNLIGTACDDGNPDTANDIYKANCDCEGTAIASFTEIPALIQAEDYFSVNNAQVNQAPASEQGGGDILGFIGDDTYMDYAVSVLEEAEFVLDFRAASPFGVSVIDILNEANGTLSTINLTPATADYDTYGTYTSDPFLLPVGEYRIRLDVVASAFNLNWIEFRYAVECDSPIGAPCDDGDAATVNDVTLINCDCVGIPVTDFTDIPGLIEAEDYSDVFNAQVNPTPTGESGGDVLGFIGDDTWMEYGVHVSEEAEFILDFRASSPFAAGFIEVLNEVGDLITTIALTPATASYDDYATFTTDPFTLPVGHYNIRLDVIASAFNLNWIAFRYSCQDTIQDLLNENITTSKSAIIGIETNGIVNAGSDLKYAAGEYVLLTEGFEVKANASFQALIEACE